MIEYLKSQFLAQVQARVAHQVARHHLARLVHQLLAEVVIVAALHLRDEVVDHHHHDVDDLHHLVVVDVDHLLSHEDRDDLHRLDDDHHQDVDAHLHQGQFKLLIKKQE